MKKIIEVRVHPQIREKFRQLELSLGRSKYNALIGEIKEFFHKSGGFPKKSVADSVHQEWCWTQFYSTCCLAHVLLAFKTVPKKSNRWFQILAGFRWKISKKIRVIILTLPIFDSRSFTLR